MTLLPPGPRIYHVLPRRVQHSNWGERCSNVRWPASTNCHCEGFAQGRCPDGVFLVDTRIGQRVGLTHMSSLHLFVAESEDFDPGRTNGRPRWSLREADRRNSGGLTQPPQLFMSVSGHCNVELFVNFCVAYNDMH